MRHGPPPFWRTAWSKNCPNRHRDIGLQIAFGIFCHVAASHRGEVQRIAFDGERIDPVLPCLALRRLRRRPGPCLALRPTPQFGITLGLPILGQLMRRAVRVADGAPQHFTCWNTSSPGKGTTSRPSACFTPSQTNSAAASWCFAGSRCCDTAATFPCATGDPRRLREHVTRRAVGTAALRKRAIQLAAGPQAFSAP